VAAWPDCALPMAAAKPKRLRVMVLIFDQPLEARPRSETRDHADSGASTIFCGKVDDLETLADRGTRCRDRPEGLNLSDLWGAGTAPHEKVRPLMMRAGLYSCLDLRLPRPHTSALKRVVSGRPARFPTFQNGVSDAEVWAEAGAGTCSGKALTLPHVALMSPSLRSMRGKARRCLHATALKTKRNVNNLTVATSVSPGRTLGR
jgi:hypothetical protein